MENPNPFPNNDKNPEPSSTQDSSSCHSLENTMLNFRNLHVTTDSNHNNAEAESLTSLNMNGRETEDGMIEGDSALDETGSVVTQASGPGHQPRQTFVTNFYLNWRNSIDIEAMIKQKIANLALDPKGTLALQTKLKQNDQRTKDKIFESIFAYMFEVMNDQYGNYVFGRLIECCDQSQLQLIVSKITLQSQSFAESLFTKHGAWSAKKLIKVLKKSPLVSDIMPVLVSNFFPVMTNRTACSVVLKCFDILSGHQNEKLYEQLIKNCLKLATDEKGCVALNNSISYIRGRHKIILLSQISTHALYLSHDPSGNYVVQRVLQMQHPNFTNKICSTLKGNYVNLSKEKSASHVVEQCLNTPYGMDYVLSDFNDHDNLWEVARDRYGNFVIQKALKVAQAANSPYYPWLVRKLRQDMQKLENSPGNHL